MKLPMATDPDDRAWQDYANCLGVDPDLFFPERGASTREAKEVCRGCIVRTLCLEYALVNGEKFGIWGGMSERERRRSLHRVGLADAGPTGTRVGAPRVSGGRSCGQPCLDGAVGCQVELGPAGRV